MSRLQAPIKEEHFEIKPLLKYMSPVLDNQEKLHDLSRNWDTLALLSKLGHAGVNMDAIKSNFTQLSQELIDHLALETLKKNIQEMQAKAQVSVDTVIRNLFERTADIGFLSTDAAIRDFLHATQTPYDQQYQQNVTALRERFKAYVANYSVYFDIVLFNPKGDVLVTLDGHPTITKSHDPLLHEALNTHKAYVETYRYHDFLPHYPQSLVYSYRVTDESSGEALGVLCLCFKFSDEMQAIFKNLVTSENKECLMLLDQKGCVIATSDAYHVPLGAQLEPIIEGSYKVVTFGGRDYLAKSALSNGYQGYYGLGWFGHIMVPLDHAFSNCEVDSFGMSENLLLAILQHGSQFKPQLKNIPLQANSIQYNLNRAIWNGNVKQSNTAHTENKQFSRSLLLEIRKTGENTKKIIGSSIANLTKTMVLSNTVFLADLIVDIMDRNLYERANDCRWWALTGAFKEILSQPQIAPHDHLKMQQILRHINALYTVYSTIIIYNTEGKIIAVSNPAQEALVGQVLRHSWVDATLSLTDRTRYVVSHFEPSVLYDNKPTYIFNASIISDASQSVVGGIGLIFDSGLVFPLENEKNKEILTLLNIQKLNQVLVEPELAHI